MYRSNKGFGLTGVAVAVLFMILTAVFSSSASSAEINTETSSNVEQSAK
ncbi:hypothetical protein [Alteromonas sp. C1M14]|nr:hypothetical protein [Alteromonas sp. C1M14]MBU2977885.1 hypothetical protein [Alteromonas sp. C1M14]